MVLPAVTVTGTCFVEGLSGADGEELNRLCKRPYSIQNNPDLPGGSISIRWMQAGASSSGLLTCRSTG